MENLERTVVKLANTQRRIKQLLRDGLAAGQVRQMLRNYQNVAHRLLHPLVLA